jgi:hypothetical protein
MVGMEGTGVIRVMGPTGVIRGMGVKRVKRVKRVMGVKRGMGVMGVMGVTVMEFSVGGTEGTRWRKTKTIRTLGTPTRRHRSYCG